MSKLAVVSAALVLATTTAAVAGTPSRADIEARELRQLGAIEQGRRDGSLTWREGIKLRAQQRHIDRIEAQLAADGRLSKADRAYVDALQDQANANIRNEKTDGWRRAWWLPRFGR